MPYTVPETEEERRRKAGVPIPPLPEPELQYGTDLGYSPGAYSKGTYAPVARPPAVEPVSAPEPAMAKPVALPNALPQPSTPPPPRPTPTGFWGKLGSIAKGAMYGAAMGGPGGMIAGGIIGGARPSRVADYEYRTQDLPRYYEDQKRELGQKEQETRIANIEEDNARAARAEERATRELDERSKDRATQRQLEERRVKLAEDVAKRKENPADKHLGVRTVRDASGVEQDVELFQRPDGSTYTKPIEGVTRQPRPEKAEKMSWGKANQQAEAEYRAGTVEQETELKKRILDQVGQETLAAAQANVDPSDPEAVAAQRNALARVKAAEAAAKRDMEVKRKAAISRRAQELMGGASETRMPDHARDKGLLQPPK